MANAKATHRTRVSPTAQRLPIDDLSGGLDLRRSPSLISANRARVLRNWSLQNPGELRVMPGWASWLSASLGNNRIQGAQRVYLSSAVFSLLAYQGAVKKPSDAGVAGSNVLTGLSSTNEIDFPFDRDLVAVFDGTNIPKKSIDGTTWTQLGINAPTVAAVLTAIAGGSLTNGNQIEVSYSYGRASAAVHEGNEGPTATVTPAGANLTVHAVLTCSTDPQVDTIYIYARDVTAGESVRRRVGSVANGVGTTTFDITSKNWTAADTAEAPTTRSVPPALKFGVIWKSRWWGVDAVVGNRLRFTEIFEPQSWPSDFYIDIPFERGDSITALVAQGDTLVVFGQTKPYLIIGQTSLDFEVRPSLGAQAGALGFRAADAIESGVLHASAEGVYLFDGATDRLLTDDVDIGWQTYVTAGTAADLARTALKYHEARKEVRVAVTNLYPFGTAGEWVLDLHRTRQSQTPAWTSTNRTVGGYSSWDGAETTTGNRGRLFTWSDSIGKMYEEATGTTADGADMIADYEGPTMATGFHQAAFTCLRGEYQPAEGSFVVEPVIDGVSVGQITIDISGGQSQYGSATYGTSTYAGSGRKMFVTDLPMEADGHSFTLRATYTGKDAFVWFTYAPDMVPEAEASGIPT
jgi:hypothetical protein